jgi:hypothetical protein
MRVLFGQLRPDLPDLLNTDLEDALNCIPLAASYGPFPDPVPYSGSASSNVNSAYSTLDTNGLGYTFVGTQTTLYRDSVTTMANVSRTATYTTASDGHWEFTTFGQTVYAVNGVDAMQWYTMGTSTRFLDQSASASAPIAAHIASVRDFIFVGNISGFANRVQWSQINLPTRWTISQQKQADFQDLPGSSKVVAITGGDFAAIFTNISVWRAMYVGAPLIFRFDEVAPGIGCMAGGSVARFQNISYFLSSSGFYAFDGEQARPIGNDKIDGVFLNDLNRGFLYRVSAVVDPVNKLYIVSYPSTASTDGICDKMIVYGWSVDKWTFVDQSLEYLFINISSALTLEGLDSYGTMETLAFSLDSDSWIGGLAILAGIDTGHRITRFSGTSKAARFITGEGQIVPDARAFVSAIRPLVQGDSATTITISVGQRDRNIDTTTWGPTVSMNSIGECPVRSNARYHRLRVDVSGGFQHVMGAEIKSRPEGVR